MTTLNKFVIGFSLFGLLSRRSIATATPFRMAEKAAYVPGSNSIVYVTIADLDSAKILAHKIIDKNLAACVNIIPQLTSIYKWEGKINEDSELLLMIKTGTDKVDQLSKFVKENHSYSVPEVISIKIENGNADYLDWITKTVQ